MSEKMFYPDRYEGRRDFGILLFNHAGSVVSQDTGRDAQFLAEHFKVPVLGVDRPYSGYRLASPFIQKKLGEDYPGVTTSLEDTIREMCVSHHIKHLIVTGRSAGGTAAVVYAAHAEMPRINIGGVYTAEMAGCGKAGDNSKAERKAARHDYSEYGNQQKQLQETNSKVIRPEPNGLNIFAKVARGISIALSYPNDMYNHDQVLGTNIALESSKKFVAENQDAYFRADFAARSAVADQTTIDQLRADLYYLDGPELTGRIAVEQPINTTHASFDNRGFYADRLGHVVDRVLFR